MSFICHYHMENRQIPGIRHLHVGRGVILVRYPSESEIRSEWTYRVLRINPSGMPAKRRKINFQLEKTILLIFWVIRSTNGEKKLVKNIPGSKPERMAPNRLFQDKYRSLRNSSPISRRRVTRGAQQFRRSGLGQCPMRPKIVLI